MDSPTTGVIRGWDGMDVVRDDDNLGSFPRRATLTPENLSPVQTPVHTRRVKMRYPPSATVRERRSPRLPRLLYKDGAYTLIPKNVPNLLSRFVTDFWTTLLDMKWSSIVLLFLASYLGIWLLFTVIFFVISYAHGDFEPANRSSDEWRHCLKLPNSNASEFTAVFLFAVETLRTIGFGARYPTDECVATVFFLCFGSIISLLFESVLVGLLLAKTHVPQQRTQTLLFSKSATICTRDNQMCLLFRIGNVRSSLLFTIVLKAFLVYAKRTEEGEEMPFHQHEIALQIDANGDNVYLGWPITAAHVIDNQSPFYHLSKKHLQKAAFELIVILEGVVESTGASIQARTSYVPTEILWGHRFQPMYTPSDENHLQRFDYAFFEATTPQEGMLEHSQFELEERANLKSEVPDVVFSHYVSATDVPDGLSISGGGGGGGDDEAATLSPSLAMALDIPLRELEYRNRAPSFTRVRRESLRPSMNPPRSRHTSNMDGPGTPPVSSLRVRKRSVYMGPMSNLSVVPQSPGDGLRLGHPCRRQSTAASFNVGTGMKRISTGPAAVHFFGGAAVRRRRKSI